MGNGLPAGFCEAGSNLRRSVSDARDIMQQERRAAEYWHGQLKRKAGALLAHQADCVACRSVPTPRAGGNPARQNPSHRRENHQPVVMEDVATRGGQA